jgi:hypothetical protein
MMPRIALALVLLPGMAAAQGNLGQANGAAQLGSAGILPLAQLPTGSTAGTVALGSAPAAAVATALPSASASQLYGGTGAAGAASPMTLGTGLSLSGGTLNASGAVSSVAGRTGAVTLSNTDIAGLGTAAVQPASAFDASGAATAAAAAAASARKALYGPYPSRTIGVPLLGGRWMNNGTSNGTTDIGGTSRVCFTTAGAVHDLKVRFKNVIDNGFGETTPSFPVTYSAVLEYPANTFMTLTYGGASTVSLQPLSEVLMDPVGISVPASTVVCVRTFVQTMHTPSFTATGSTTGGTLAAGTYNYRVTAVGGAAGESVAAANVAVTTTGSTSSVQLVITAPAGSTGTATQPTAYNIYRGLTYSASLFTQIPAQPNTTTWTDTGAQAASLTPTVYPYGTTTIPTYPIGPSNQGATVTAGPSLPAGQGDNYVSAGGNGSNQLTTNGTAWEASGTNNLMYGPTEIEATPDAGLDLAVVMTAGDSICSGTGDVYDRGYIMGALMTAGIPYFDRCRLGAYMYDWIQPLARSRMLNAAAVSDIVDEGNTNDISIGGVTQGAPSSLATVQAQDLVRWAEWRKRGPAGTIYPRIWKSTLLPRVVTNDSLKSTANQVPGGITIAGATNASPMVLTLSGSYASGFANGNQVTIQGGAGNTAMNGTFYIGAISANTFELFTDAGLTMPVAGNGTYTANSAMLQRPAVEAVREGYNTWVRAGCPVTVSGTAAQIASWAGVYTPVTAGTAGAIVAGQAGHPLAGVFDPAGAIEVNASGVLTLNGGYWPYNSSTGYYYSIDGTHPTQADYAALSATVPVASMVAP